MLNARLKLYFIQKLNMHYEKVVVVGEVLSQLKKLKQKKRKLLKSQLVTVLHTAKKISSH